MNTNIKISLTDAERAMISHNAFGRKAPVSRKELNELIQEHIRGLIEGRKETEHPTREDAEGPPALITEAERDRSVREFVPSRGDESYLAQPKDAGIAAACSRILDDTALIEQFAWDTIEKNRKQ